MDIHTWANSIDPDQMPHSVASDQVYTVYNSSSGFLDITTASKMDLLKGVSVSKLLGLITEIQYLP